MVKLVIFCLFITFACAIFMVDAKSVSINDESELDRDDYVEERPVESQVNAAPSRVARAATNFGTPQICPAGLVLLKNGDCVDPPED